MRRLLAAILTRRRVTRRQRAAIDRRNRSLYAASMRRTPAEQANYWETQQ